MINKNNEIWAEMQDAKKEVVDSVDALNHQKETNEALNMELNELKSRKKEAELINLKRHGDESDKKIKELMRSLEKAKKKIII